MYIYILVIVAVS